jgi:hypothetical protein
METRTLWLALSGLAMVSCAEGDDSSGNGDGGGVGDESDADTDADSDTDTDADTDADSDTDVQGWDADTIQVDASFGFDAATGTIHTMTYGGATLPNAVSATIYNSADLGTANPTQFCFVTWTLPEGAFASNGDFPAAEYWTSFDLGGAQITYSGVTSATGPKGDCEGMQSFLGSSRGSADLASFAATFGIGFGVQSIANVPTATVNDWRSNSWPANYAATYGAWNSISAAFAAGSFTVQGSTPNQADVMIAFVVDEKSWDVPIDDAGASTLVPMTGLTAPPTGYYQSLAMYSLGGVD